MTVGQSVKLNLSKKLQLDRRQLIGTSIN